MDISASMVRDLRERSGAGMMECKKALIEATGDMEVAFDILRKAGAAKAAKKAARIAAEGAIVHRHLGERAVLVEVNSETDFVAKDENFRSFADAVAQTVLDRNPADLDVLMRSSLLGSSESVEGARAALVAKIGENISVRRFAVMASRGGVIGSYLHGTRIGVLVDLHGGDAALAKEIAMHVAATRPVCVSDAEVPPEMIAKEREIYAAQSAASGKSPDIIEKMIEGKLKKFLNEVSLLGQPFVRDPEITVGKLLARQGASVKSFVRMEVGEGIERKTENFAEEVRKQAQGGS